MLETCSEDANSTNSKYRNTPKSFTRDNRSYMLTQGRQDMHEHLLHTKDLSKILWRVNILSVVLRPERKSHWVPPDLVQLSRGIFFKAHDIHCLPSFVWG